MTSIREKQVSMHSLLLFVGVAFLLRLLFLPLIPLVDPTEGRYAIISQEMAVSGDWLTPRLMHNGESIPFLGKPPMFFWCAAACMRWLGENEFAARLPSFAGSVVLVILMLRILTDFLNYRTAVLAVLITVLSPVFFILSGAVAVDMLLGLFVAGALFAYFAFASEVVPQRRKRWSLLVFLLLAGGFMTKGPVAIILFGMPVFCWTCLRKKWSLLKDHSWLVGSFLFLALTVPWFWMCEVRNPSFLRYFFINENLLRYLVHDYGDLYGSGHEYPRGAAVIMMFVAVLPWAIRPLWQWSRQPRLSLKMTLGDDTSSFFFIGFGGNVLFWCLARQLLITYMVPMIPLFGAWLAYSWTRGQLKPEPHLKALAFAWLALMFFGALVATVAVRDSKSAKSIMCAIRESGVPCVRSASVTFARHIPYSAYFYGRGQVLPHPKEPVSISVERTFADSDHNVLVVMDKYLSAIPIAQFTKLRELTSCGRWRLFGVDHENPLNSVELAGLIPERQGHQSSASVSLRAWE